MTGGNLDGRPAGTAGSCRAGTPTSAAPDGGLAGRRPHRTLAREAEAVLREALRWARRRDYAGWDPYDGLNSPLLAAVGVHWLPRLLGIQLVSRSPVNLRPLLSVPRERNPKGIALFARTYLYRYELTGDPRDLDRAEALLSWLETHRSPHATETSWGYNFDWQNGRKFHLPADHPSVVVSVFCGEAFLHHAAVTGDADSLETAAGVARFITADLNTVRVGNHLAYAYTPYDEFVVVNANALAGSYLARVGARRDSTSLLERADEIASLVVDAQTASGAWHYAIPPEDSPLTHDNFHTGYVLEALRDYNAARGDVRGAARSYEDGLRFYVNNLFEPNGAPKFDHEHSYPRDAHAAAQAIRTLVGDGRDELLWLAQDVVHWSLDRLYDEDGFFYRKRGRFVDDTVPYMRWSQAWMCLGLASYVAHVDETETTLDRRDPAGQPAPEGASESGA